MKKLLLLCLSLCFAMCAQAQFSMLDSYKPQVYTDILQEKLPMRVFRNASTTAKKLPMVIMLHGSGECGTNNVSQLGMFAPIHKQALLSQEQAIYVIPQCTTRSAWVRKLAFEPSYRMPRYPAPAMRILKSYIDDAIASGDADPDRIYLIGVSLGSFGTWDALSRWPNFFAAAVPICGGSSMQDNVVDALATTSIWAWHGEKDASVNVNCSRRIVEALLKKKAPIRYNEIPGAGHNIWGKPLSDPEVFKWIFAQRRGVPWKPDDPGFMDALFDTLRSYVSPANKK